MSKGKTATIILLVCLGLVFFGLSLYVYFFFSIPKKCRYGCGAAPSFYNGPQCLSVQEIYSDPTIPAPVAQIYLSNLAFSQGSGPAYCSPMWYAFRYVRNSDGGYSTMSPWTPMITAGGSNLPWAPAMANPPSASTTCSANQATLGIYQTLNLDTNFGQADGYTLNVHRQVGTLTGGVATGFDPASEGQVIGFFDQSEGTAGGGAMTAEFIDAVFNPSPNSTATSCC